jgi:hypothetical protein
MKPNESVKISAIVGLAFAFLPLLFSIVCYTTGNQSNSGGGWLKFSVISFILGSGVALFGSFLIWFLKENEKLKIRQAQIKEDLERTRSTIISLEEILKGYDKH